MTTSGHNHKIIGWLGNLIGWLYYDFGHISVHIVEKIKDGWTSGYNGKWMNEKDKNIHLDHWKTLSASTWMYKKKVIMNWMGLLKNDYLIKNGGLP
jgi:hypothetical protein